jgi:aromatic ring-opening dioxygenase catalytic subunit (LigB family)
MRPAQSLTDLKTPIVPILINCYYAPQPTAARCYQVGKAVREIVEEFPGNLRIAFIGSGGLWHTPRQERRLVERGVRRSAARAHGARRYQGDGRLLR